MLSRLHVAAPPRPQPKPAAPGRSERPDTPPHDLGSRGLRASILNSWANVNRRGHDNLFHDHPQAVISGVYFIADGASLAAACAGCGGCGGNGSLEFIDPRYSLRTHVPPAEFEPHCHDLAAPDRQLRPGYMFEYSRPLHVRPHAGTLVLFPSWLMHRVRQHALPGARVSVSFNLWVAQEADGGIGALRGLFDGVFMV
jgi:uncharacterized protein (TIGR02466 family)